MAAAFGLDMDDVLNLEPEVYTQLCDGGAGGKHGVGWAAMRAADLPVYIKVGCNEMDVGRDGVRWCGSPSHGGVYRPYML